MRNSSIPYILLPLAAALALIVPFSLNQTSPRNVTMGQATPTPSPTPEIGDLSEQPEGTASRLLYDFLGVDPKQRDAAGCDDANHPARRHRVEFLIATLPDPKDSRLNYLFDRNLDAIQRALEASDYVLDRYNLPWLDRSGKKREAPLHHEQPGVILFRHSREEKLLALFIVGETPTSGIHKQALSNALDQVVWLSGWGGPTSRCLPAPGPIPPVGPFARCEGAPPPNSNVVRLLAPTFSGSQDSLGVALQIWLSDFDRRFRAGQRPSLRVISGSATAVNLEKYCRRLEGQPKFLATVLSNRAMLSSIIDYFNDRDPRLKGRKIALLTEANTGYGMAASRIGDDGTVKIPFPLHISQLRSASERARATRVQPGVSLPDARGPLLPLLLEDPEGAEEVIPLFSQFEKASLELSLTHLLSEIDREQFRYVGIIATDVQDIIFLARELRRHAPNVVIFTLFSDLIYLRPEINTDLRGTLTVSPYPLFNPNQFWTNSFRGNNVRLQFPAWVTQGAYNATLALLGRTERMQEYGFPFDYRGKEDGFRRPVLWLSFVGGDQIWPLRVFPDQQRGYRYGDYAFAAPSVPQPDRPDSSPRREINLTSGLNSKSTIALLLLLAAVGVLVGLVLLADLSQAVSQQEWLGPYLRPFRFRRLSRGWPGEMFGDSVYRNYKLRIRSYLLACCVSLLFIYAPFVWVSLLPKWAGWRLASKSDVPLHWEDSFTWVPLIIGFVTVLLIPSLVWLFLSVTDWQLWILADVRPDPGSGRRSLPTTSLGRTIRRWSGELAAPTPAVPGATANKYIERRQRFAIRTFLAILTLAVLATIIYICIQPLRKLAPEEQIFLFLRATALTDGASPLLPLLMIGIAGFACAFSSLRRMKLLERLCSSDQGSQTFLNFEGEGRESWIGLASYEREIIARLGCPAYQLPAWYALLVVILIPYFLLFWVHFIPTIEGGNFDLIFRVGFLLVMVFLALAFLRFCFVWVTLRRLLRRLSLHPMFARRGAAAKDEEAFPGMPRINLTSPAPNYNPLAFSVHQGRHLIRALGEGASAAELRPHLIAAEEGLAQALSEKAAGNWRDALINRCATQSALARAAGQVARWLEPHWRTRMDQVKGEEGARSEAELFLVSRIAAFLHLILAHMQNLVVFVTGGMILLLLAISQYPFQPRDRLLLFGWILIMAVVAVTIGIFVQMERDSLLSIFTGSTPGKVEFNSSFVGRLLLHGLLPILALLSAQFPDALRQIFSWLDVFRGGIR